MGPGLFEAELDEALGLSSSPSPQPSPLSDHSSGFHYEPVVAVSEREGSPARRQRRPPSKKRQRQQQQLHTASASAQLESAEKPAEKCTCYHRAPPAGLADTSAGVPTPASTAACNAPADGTCALHALPLQLLIRLLSFLSAQDLSAVAQTSALLRSLSDEPVLWRRLFCARWGKPQGQQQLPPKTWKARYVERDLAELAEACARAPPDLPAASLNAAAPGTAAAAAAAALVADASNMFVEAQLAKRQRALGRAHVDDPMEVPDDVARKVEAWRAARGFAPLSRPSAAAAGGGASSSACQQVPVPQQAAGAPRLGTPGSGGAAAAGRSDGGDAVDPLGQSSRRGVASGAAQQGGKAAADQVGGCTGRPAGSSVQEASPRGVRQLPHVAAHERLQQRQQQGQGQGLGGGSRASVHRWCRVAGTANVYCNESTGDVHVCDESCMEHVMERSSGLLVCPISGTVRDDLRSIPQLDDNGDEDEEQAAQMEGDFGGRLARAFEMGYYAESLEELERTCFVPRR